MKHLSVFENFVNEMQSAGTENRLPDFEFAIDIRNSTKEELNSTIKEFDSYSDYVKIDNYTRQYLLSNDSWALYIHIHNCVGSMWIEYGRVTTPNWGAGIKYMEDIITIKEFLNVGLAGVKEYIELKKASDKYNL
jgi:hypothetical protein